MNRRQYLLATTMPHAMPVAQMAELRKQLNVLLLTWDAVTKARAQANG